MTSTPRILHAATGSTLTAKGWGQEAALRMLHNNLDPAVAEHPENLVVYGGTGKAGRQRVNYAKLLKISLASWPSNSLPQRVPLNSAKV